MPARKPSRRPGRYCNRLSRVFASAVVPDDYQRAAELLVRGARGPGVIGLGEALAPVAAATAAGVHAAGQPGPVPGPDGPEPPGPLLRSQPATIGVPHDPGMAHGTPAVSRARNQP